MKKTGLKKSASLSNSQVIFIEKKEGIIITFEGIEGCGKTTQVALLKTYLGNKGLKVTTTREPGGTIIGNAVRGILLDPDNKQITKITELFLYEGCRAQLLAEQVKPILNRGEILICDRFTDSTIAYQGYARGIDLDIINRLNLLATDGLTPFITFLLDIGPEAGLARAKHRNSKSDILLNEDRFEREVLEFHEKVRHGFLSLAENEPERIKIINAAKSVQDVQKQIVREIEATNIFHP